MSIWDLEKQNEESIEYLVNEYLAYKKSRHPEYKKIKNLLEQIKQKPIEEILNDYER
jgi:HEPN domain-containing protein